MGLLYRPVPNGQLTFDTDNDTGGEDVPGDQLCGLTQFQEAVQGLGLCNDRVVDQLPQPLLQLFPSLLNQLWALVDLEN